MAQPSTTLLILGASGDLTNRLLLPGIGTLLAAEPKRRLEIVGADLRELTQEEWQSRVSNGLAPAAGSAAAKAVLSSTRYVTSNATDPNALQQLLAGIAADRLVIYFALPPHVTQLVCATLESVGVPAGTILAIEKPFGAGLATARELNALVTRIVPEDQVFRIDHFLGLYTVLNLLGMRFANRMFEAVWNRDNIERVEIFYDETVALEGRAGYYDGTGALRDMIQSHLLQVLALIAIDPPATIHHTDLRDAISQVLRATRVVDVVKHTRRGRYTAGKVEGRTVPDYVSEDGVKPALQTETIAEVQVEVANSRWKGVPFVLRSGKALGKPKKQAVITFKAPAHVPEGFGGVDRPDTLTIDFRPDSFSLCITTNGHGDPFTLEQSTLTGALGGGKLEPYGEVLATILDGDPRLVVRGDAAEECWRIIEPVVTAWKKDAVPLVNYAAGSKGPRGWKTSR